MRSDRGFDRPNNHDHGSLWSEKLCVELSQIVAGDVLDGLGIAGLAPVEWMRLRVSQPAERQCSHALRVVFAFLDIGEDFGACFLHLVFLEGGITHDIVEDVKEQR